MQSDRPLLSIGLIVKNEAARLGRCLEALAPLRAAIPCQLVIADTGSTDKTREIAAQYADELFDFTWIGDFAAARNAVMERCTGVWYLTVDADEYLDPDFHELTDVLLGEECQSLDFLSISQRNYKRELYGDSYTELMATRMTRMDAGFRYEGTIHESFVLPQDAKRKILPGVVLHHDGYSVVDGKRLSEKRSRNMALLDKELRRAPNDLRRVMQCIESAPQTATALRYVKRGLRIIREGKSRRPWAEPIIYRYGLTMGQDDKTSQELEELLAEGLEHYPESIYLRLDGQGACLAACYKASRFPEAVEHGLAWEDGLTAYDNRDFDLEELTFSTLNLQNTEQQNKLRSMLFHSLVITQRWEDAGRVLERLNTHGLTNNEWKAVATLLLSSITKIPGGEVGLQRMWDEAQAAAAGDRTWKSRYAALRKALAEAFLPQADEDARAARPVVARLDGDVGRCARAMLSEDPQAVGAELEEITSWPDAFPALFPHVMALGMDFPDVFYRIHSGRMSGLAAGMADAAVDLTGAVLAFAALEGPWETPSRLTWLYDAVAVALRAEKWKDEARGKALCALFAKVSQLYLYNFYNPDLLNGEDIGALPGMHSFSWYYLEALRALEAGEHQACLRLLREGVEVASAMGGMVRFLSKRLEADPQAAQMEAMAAALKAKLDALRAAGSPEADLLLQSPAYARFKHLIDDPA